jgi:hypothetical protein
VHYGDGKGGFTRVDTVMLGVPYSVRGAGAQDVNGDGLPDLTMKWVGFPF